MKRRPKHPAHVCHSSQSPRAAWEIETSDMLLMAPALPRPKPDFSDSRYLESSLDGGSWPKPEPEPQDVRPRMRTGETWQCKASQCMELRIAMLDSPGTSRSSCGITQAQLPAGFGGFEIPTRLPN